MKHLYITTPVYDQWVSTGYAQSLLMTAVACTRAGIVLSGPDFKGGPYIHDNRNWLVHRFLRTDADAMLFIDADVTWDENAVVNLYQSGHDLCGGAYPKKADDECYPVKLLSATDGRYREAAYLPGGFMLIRRGVFDALKDKVDSYTDQSMNGERVYEYFQNRVHHGDYKLGEDIEFCRRWRALGGRVWCLPDIDFCHQGTKAWAGNLGAHLSRAEMAVAA